MANDLSDKRESVLEIVKFKGPLLPVQIAKDIGTNIMFAGAMLSELVSNGKIRITNVKVGGSPLYYTDNQIEKLQDLVKHLNEKDRQTALLLKEKKVLRDTECNPLQRVSLREIKDFAKPLQAKENEQVELFWKWYLVSDDEAKDLIEEVMKEYKPVEEVKKVEKKIEIEKEVKKIKPKVERKKPTKGLGLKNVNDYFNQNNIKILNADVVNKNKEVNYVVEITSDIGNLNFFVKFKDKRKIEEGDLSLALNEAKNMPLIFLSNGELSKKAKKLIENEFKGIIFRKL